MNKKSIRKGIFTILLSFIFIFEIDCIYAYKEYNVGDIVNYNLEDYYVIEKSGKNKNFIKLLKKDVLTTNEINTYSSDEEVEVIGTVPFGKDIIHCQNNANNESCTNNYDETLIKKIVDNWSASEFPKDALVEVNGYKSRILDESDFDDLNVKCKYNMTVQKKTYNFNIESNDTTEMFESSFSNYHLKFIVYYYENEQGISVKKPKEYYSCLPYTTSVSNRDFSDSYYDEYFSNSDNIQICNMEHGSQGLYYNSVGVLGDIGKISGNKDLKVTVTYTSSLEPITENVDNCARKTYTNLNNYDWLEYRDLSYWITNKADNYHSVLYLDPNTKRVELYQKEIINDRQYDKKTIRPVLNVKKSIFGNKNDYSVGDSIKYNNKTYYVIQNSDSSKDYVVIMKFKPLTQLEMDVFGDRDKGLSQFFASNTCDSSSNNFGCELSYNTSFVKKILDNWSKIHIKDYDLVKFKGNDVRLIELDELIDNLGYLKDIDTMNNIRKSDDTPSWVYTEGELYWMMPYISDDIFSTKYDIYKSSRISDYVLGSSSFDKGQIRPLIILNKCALNDSQCEYCPNGLPKYKTDIKYISFNKGETINIKDKTYYVLEDSSSNQDYVKLLKAMPFTVSELEKYGKDENGDLFVNKYCKNGNNVIPESNTNFKNGLMCFTTNEDCKIEYYGNGSLLSTSGCTNQYDKSDVKKVIDNWVKYEFPNDELIEINGYKARLLNEDDVINKLGIEKEVHSPDNKFNILEDLAEFLKGDYSSYWTMINDIQSEQYILAFAPKKIQSKINEQGEWEYEFSLDTVKSTSLSQHSVRPVINLKKSALDDAIVYTQTLASCDEITDNEEPEKYPENPENIENDPDTVVNVPSTLSSISLISIILSGVLIMTGVSIILYRIYKTKK